MQPRFRRAGDQIDSYRRGSGYSRIAQPVGQDREDLAARKIEAAAGSTRTAAPHDAQDDGIASAPGFGTVDLSCADGAFDVVMARLDVSDDAVHAFTELLSDAERGRAERFIFDRDRRRFIVARARLRRLLGAKLGVRPKSVELVYGPHGKPALAGRHADSGLRFNLSHCEDTALYAFAYRRDIGVDIEFVRAIPDADAVAARFFSRRENEAYLSLAPQDKPLGFFNCWTRKEAFIKAIGDGLHYPLDCFDVSLAPNAPANIISVEGRPGDACGWILHGLSPGPGLTGGVVVQGFADELRANSVAPKPFAPDTMRHR